MNRRLAILGLATVVMGCVSTSGRGVETSLIRQWEWLEPLPSDDSLLIFGWLGVAGVGDMMIPLRAGENRIDVAGGVARIDGVVVGLDLDKDSARAWLLSAPDEQRRTLRYVLVDDDLPPAATAAVQDLAQVHRAVSLGFKSDSVAARTLPLFRPRILTLESSLTAQQAAQQSQIEILTMDATVAGSLQPLRLLPNLRHLLVDWNVSTAGMLPRSLRLESLTVWGEGDGRDRVVNLDSLRGIRRISLKEMVVEAGYSSNTQLQTLDLSRSELRGRRDLAHLTALRRFGLPTNMTGKDLTNFVAAHPRLDAIAMTETDSLGDLTALRRLPNLREVVLGQEYVDVEWLKLIPSLRLVGLPKEMWEKDSSRVVALQQAMPQVNLVKVATFCLGSGWILLVAVAGIGGIVARRRRAMA